MDNIDFKFQETADPRSLSILGKIASALVKIYIAIPKQLVLPKVFPISGYVEVTKLPPVTISNLNELSKHFNELAEIMTLLSNLSKTDNKRGLVDVTGIINAIEDLQKSVKDVNKSSDTIILRKILEINKEMASRPTLTTPPVTNVNVNALQGVMKTTDNTVGTTLVTLPNYGQLNNRRTLQIYNNSSNTIYYGGSDVSVSNGIPVLPSSFSASIDAGYNMKIYAVSSQANNDVRVVEVSKDTSGNIQE